MSDEIIKGLLPTKEELEEQGLVDEDDEIEQRAQKEADGLEDANIVAD